MDFHKQFEKENEQWINDYNSQPWRSISEYQEKYIKWLKFNLENMIDYAKQSDKDSDQWFFELQDLKEKRS